MSLWYRVGQFWRTLTAVSLPDVQRQAAAAVLSADEMGLFARFSAADQWHSYRVMRTLQEAGHHHPDLLKAALLHDVGKTRAQVTIWDRVVVVAAERVGRRRTAVWGVGEPVGWKRPFVVRAQHPAWGAEMARAAGSGPLVVYLIRRHQDPLPETAVSEEDHLLRLLQWADNQN